jgi:hypothetical protein
MHSSSLSEREVFWRSLIERRELMQLTVGVVCEQAGVAPASFFYWQKKLRRLTRERDALQAAPLVPVRIVDDRRSELTLELPNGMRLLIPQGCDEATLQQVVRVAMAATRGTESC